MSRAYVDAVKVLMDRLTEARQNDKRLSYVKRLYFGTRKEVTGISDCPAITVTVQSINDIFENASYYQIQTDMEIKMILEWGLADGRKQNVLNDEYDLGILSFIEDVLDVFYEDTSEDFQPTLDNLLYRAPLASVSEITKETDNIWRAEIIIPARIACFKINERSS